VQWRQGRKKDRREGRLNGQKKYDTRDFVVWTVEIIKVETAYLVLHVTISRRCRLHALTHARMGKYGNRFLRDSQSLDIQGLTSTTATIADSNANLRFDVRLHDSATDASTGTGELKRIIFTKNQ
jgi:hypothetical protein